MGVFQVEHTSISNVFGTVAVVAAAGVLALSSLAAGATPQEIGHTRPADHVIRSIRVPEPLTSPLVLGSGAVGGILTGLGALSLRSSRRDSLYRA